MQTRAKTIQHATKKRKERDKNINDLQKQIEMLEIRLTSGDVSVCEDLNKLKQDHQAEIEKRNAGVRVRSRLMQYEQGEKSTKYFLNLEKQNYNSKVISRLQLADGSIETDAKNISKEEANFYKKLFTKSDNVSRNMQTETFLSPKLSEDQKTKLEGPITEAELLAALKDTENNKSPGNDGLPAEFYKVFWIDLKEQLVKTVNYAYDHGSLRISQRQGIINLIPKKGKDPLS